ncbi:hypothetical protein KR018_006574, partial [Drosophila ironensis]
PKKSLRSSDLEIYGNPPLEKQSNANRVYGLTFILAVLSMVQWTILSWYEVTIENMSHVRYGWWLVITFFVFFVLAWTEFGRKVPYNYIIIALIVESSTFYIALEQKISSNYLVNVYANTIVICLMITAIIWGAYFPMFLVPGDLLLSILLAGANIMLIVFFVNAAFFDNYTIYMAARNSFAVDAFCMVMYTATIIHNRQFNVPSTEYLFLSVMQFLGFMILHERVLTLASGATSHAC